MQKQTKQATPTRTRTLAIHGRLSRRSMHRRFAGIVGAILLVGVWTLALSKAGPEPGASP
jgi:hypothetical protein